MPGWTPLFFRAEHEAAVRTALRRIASSVADDDAAQQTIEPSLTAGSAGRALFLFHAAELLDCDETFQAGALALRAALRHLPPSLRFFSGATGIAWLVEHLSRWVDDPDTDEIDHLLHRALTSTDRWSDDYDLFNGLTGYGVYLCRHLVRAPASALSRESLEAVIRHLDQISEQAAGARTWLRSAHLLASKESEEHPGGLYVLGAAHGVPGPIALLARCVALGHGGALVHRMLMEAISWLLAQRLPRGADARFAGWVEPGQRPTTPWRSTWCYGDPGVAAVLLAAGQATGNEAWKDEALELMLGVARRSRPRAGIVDPSLCHGAAGLGHIFNRVYQATGVPELGDAARSWLLEAVRMMDDPRVEWYRTSGLLMGLSGVGLALCASVSEEEPTWDEIFLMS
ncbi:MAG TPA: lanthionine synthetase C family protein [Polyangia bacterium]|nr:lanthionine synthetase C family protein [Polyangia bacterium]